MKTRPVLIPAMLLLAACSPAVPDAAPEPTTAPPVTAEATQDPTEAPTTEAPEECMPGEAETPLAEAIHATTLPTGAAVLLVQELEDIDTGDLDLVVHLCAQPLEGDPFRAVATDLAITVRDAGAEVDEMIVYQYAPDGAQGEALSVDGFGLYTWDRDAAVAPETNWS